MKGFRNIYAPMVQNSGLSSLLKKKLVLSKGLKYVKWTTHWAQKSGLTLTFEHVTWKSIGIIYLLGSTPAPSLVLIKWRGQKILSEQKTGLKSGLTLTFEQVTWKSIGIIFSLRANPASSWYWSSEGVKRYRADNTWSTDRPTDWQLQNNMSPFSRGA